MPDKTLDTQDQRILKALKLVEGRIIGLAGKLDVTASCLTTGDVNLASALELRNQIFAEFEPYFKEARKITNSFDSAMLLSKARFKEIGVQFDFTLADGDLVRAYSDDAYKELEALGVRNAAAIGTMVYEGALTGMSVDELNKGIKQILVGGTDKKGRPMANYAATIANTRYMEIDAVMTKRKGVDFGIEKYKYYGSLIANSRSWCASHVGKEYTAEEIAKWAASDWGGKKGGDPFIARGGFNCRHHFVPVVVDPAKDAFDKFVTDSMDKPRRLKKGLRHIVGEIPKSAIKLSSASTRDIIVESYVIEHMLRTKKKQREQALPESYVRGIQSIIKDPKAILLDKKDNALLYIFDVEGDKRLGKVVVHTSKRIKNDVVNSVRSGGLVMQETLSDPAAYKLIKGSL